MPFPAMKFASINPLGWQRRNGISGWNDSCKKTAEQLGLAE
jgi:hypothetical protein